MLGAMGETIREETTERVHFLLPKHEVPVRKVEKS